MLNRSDRADLIVRAVGLTLHELAPDCLSHAILGVSGDLPTDEMWVVVQWHTDGAHGPSDLPRAWLRMGSVLSDSRGIEVLAEEIAAPEVRRHLHEDHR